MLNNQSAYPSISKIHLGELKKLHQKKFRKAEKKVMVEGWNLIEQLISNGIKPEQIISTEPEAVLQKFPDYTGILLTAKEHELNNLAETETPQSIIAVFQIPERKIGDYKVILYLDGIQDPGNLGTIYRIAAAFNLDGIALSQDCCDVFSPKVIRASLGSVFWLPSQIADAAWLNRQTAVKIGLAANSSISLKEMDIDKGKAVVIVLGSEGNGISNGIRAELTKEVRIPISGQMESLNAAVAAGIAVYEISQRLFLLT